MSRLFLHSLLNYYLMGCLQNLWRVSFQKQKINEYKPYFTFSFSFEIVSSLFMQSLYFKTKFTPLFKILKPQTRHHIPTVLVIIIVKEKVVKFLTICKLPFSSHKRHISLPNIIDKEVLSPPKTFYLFYSSRVRGP